MKGRALIASAFIALAFGLTVRDAQAQPGVIRVDLPRTFPFPAAPEIVVHTENFSAASGLLRIRLRLALDANFGLVVYDSIVAGTDGRFITRRLLPEDRDIYYDASVIDFNGQLVQEQRNLAGRTGKRLTLVPPKRLNERQPTFAWRSAPVTAPPGPWVYELSITNVARQETRSRPGILDTTFTIPDTLQANTSYRWRVVARLPNGLPGDSAAVNSESSFIIAPADAPVATLLYQNFPNPFPAPSSSTTCIWFDLQLSSNVQLTILDIRGNRVKTLIPGQLGSSLGSGRYGRREADAGGCDPRLAWDGTADDGRTVRAGVYLVRLKTSTSAESIKKIVFLGR